MERFLKLGVFIKLVQNLFRKSVLLQINGDAHAVFIGLIPDIFDVRNFLFMVEIGNRFYELGLVDLIRNLGNYYLKPSFALHDFGFAAHDNRATAGGVGVSNILFIVNRCSSWIIIA